MPNPPRHDITGEKHHCCRVPDKVLMQVLDFILDKRLTRKQAFHVLNEEGYKVSLPTVHSWASRKKRTTAPIYDSIFYGREPKRDRVPE